MERINHRVAIITTIVISFLRLITEPRIVQSIQTRAAKRHMLLMIDRDVIWFNKQGNCSIIFELGYIIIKIIL
jgi:hypothetical protein